MGLKERKCQEKVDNDDDDGDDEGSGKGPANGIISEAGKRWDRGSGWSRREIIRAEGHRHNRGEEWK